MIVEGGVLTEVASEGSCISSLRRWGWMGVAAISGFRHDLVEMRPWGKERALCSRHVGD